MTRLPTGFSAEASLEVRRSVFYAHVARADDEAAARQVIAEARRRRPQARHHCSAFVVSVADANPVERSSDDGEPAGTAGAPILAAVQAAALIDAVVVVSRIFGGVKLGTGGLARAYGQAAAQVIAGTPRVERVIRTVWSITVDHTVAGRLLGDLAARGAQVDPEYGAEVRLTVSCDDDVWLRTHVAEASAGRAHLVPIGTRQIERPLG